MLTTAQTDKHQILLTLVIFSRANGKPCLMMLGSVKPMPANNFFAVSQLNKFERRFLNLTHSRGTTFMELMTQIKKIVAPSFRKFQISKFKLLPPIVSQSLATMYNFIGDGHTWPESISFAGNVVLLTQVRPNGTICPHYRHHFAHL